MSQNHDRIRAGSGSGDFQTEYSKEYAGKMNKLMIKTRNTGDGISETLSWAERVIRQAQYQMLDVMEPRQADAVAEKVRAGDVLCLFQVTELVFSRAEGSQERFSTILNSLHACGASCLMLLQCQNGHSELYLGAVNKRRYDNAYFLSTIRETLRIGIEGNLPGTDLKEIVSRQEIQDKLDECLDNGFDSRCITAISCVPGNQSAPHGVERLLEAIGRRNFTLMVLADPVDPERMKLVRQGYEALGTQLSGLEERTFSQQTGSSTTVTRNVSESVTESWSQNISMTQSHTTGNGWSSARDDAESRMKRLTGVSVGLMTGSFLAMSAANSLLNPTPGSESGHEDHSVSNQSGEMKGGQRTGQESSGESNAESRSDTQGCTVTDYHVKGLRERVSWYLQWLNQRENLGMFNSCAYVISGSPGINLMVASQYQALMQAEGEMNLPAAINTWTGENGVERIRESLLHLNHPSFAWKDMPENFTPAVLQSSKELARQMALPERSVPGITVMEYAPFGREVVRKVPLRNGRVVRVGRVSHMGRVSDQPVVLDVQSLASHTFVAGTNGSGKSNTVFCLLEGLQEAKIPFLVIEPAKGEYRNVFGQDADVRVLGTNPRRSELLRINPFWFNEDVNVLEHIDRLLSVFNASWPMYAAMPAVLKAALEAAYRACGWNLKESVCRGVRIFPTVRDVLEQFSAKMDDTAFSQEVRGNYVGALSTRMESLCNGIYGEIFGGANLSDEALFDSNVIIDLSRVGSPETKAMLMGMLLIRLQEYRMRTEAMNLPLRHVTVLEEAHHLLKRVTTSGGDGGDLVGKSVEMISSAIAEMRSYGEGFLIVDQSPGLLDLSVMRNTNTKIVLRLPEGSDRTLVGNTMGLSQEQMFEISRLKTGMSVICQQNWLEAVLCQVDRASHSESVYTCADTGSDDLLRKRAIVDALLAARDGRPEEGETRKRMETCVAECGLAGKTKRRILGILSRRSGHPGAAETAELIYAVTGDAVELPWEGSDTEEWLRDTLEDERLRKAWGKALPEVIRAQAQILAGTNPDWASLLNSLPALQDHENSRFRVYRGNALARVCPAGRRPPENMDPAALEEAWKNLREGEPADRRLAELLRNMMDQNSARPFGSLHPWAEIVWKLTDGDRIWHELAPLMSPDGTDAWDAAARRALRQYVTADQDTETAVLSLFLQCRGTLPEVRAFYPRWYNGAKRRHE